MLFLFVEIVFTLYSIIQFRRKKHKYVEKNLMTGVPYQSGQLLRKIQQFIKSSNSFHICKNYLFSIPLDILFVLNNKVTRMIWPIDGFILTLVLSPGLFLEFIWSIAMQFWLKVIVSVSKLKQKSVLGKIPFVVGSL